MERPQSIHFRTADLPSNSATPSPTSDRDIRQLSEDLENYEEIKEYMKEVDEILDYMKPFPRTVEKLSHNQASSHKFDHLENLVRLVEQLKELKSKNAEFRSQYQKDTRARVETRRKTIGEHTFDIPPPPPDPSKKHRPSLPFRKSSRSKSVSANEFFASERLSAFGKSPIQGKAKVSKWTKVKEAFRWEKASQLETRLKHSRPERIQLTEGESGTISESRTDRRSSVIVDENRTGSQRRSEVKAVEVAENYNENREISSASHMYLQVPDKCTESSSPADSVLSGQASSCASSSCQLASSGYSGEHSHSSILMLDLVQKAQSLQELSSSSEDEKNEDTAAVSHSVAGGPSKGSLIFDETETRRSKSLDGENILGPSSHLLHLSKESLPEESKKQHKTPWGKVKDIIQTRTDSLKKRPKKREQFKAESEAFSATIRPIWTWSESQISDDVSSPEDLPKEVKPSIEITYEKAPQMVCQHGPQRFNSSNIRPLTPVLTLTRPSTEELQNLITNASEVSPPSEPASSSSLVDEKNPTLPDRPSRWGRVKKAFLTSATPEEQSPGPSSVPSSPLYLGSFFSDNESDELSSGEWIEDTHEKLMEPCSSPGLLMQPNSSDIDKTTQETDCINPSNEISKISVEEKPNASDEIPRKPRESLSIPLPTLDDLSPEFKKKLDEWKKIKKTPGNLTFTKEEAQGHFISRIGEWQRWRPGSSHHTKGEPHPEKEHHFQRDEFYKKLEEWQMLKSGKRSRSHSDRGKEDRDYQTPSPGLSRKNSKGATKKITNGKSSGSESLSGSLKEKEGRAGRRSQKEKNLQWLEKELHKIEREKMRLEREREKYLEREARLEQMKRSMGSTTPTQEVLIQTATGFFRFEGISQKFTKKLYEWEKARGIAPEASTFALLQTASVACRARDDRGVLQRSKSMGSAIDSSGAAALSQAHHPSSLSLNDVDDLEAIEQAPLLAGDDLQEGKDDDEPEALIVDVEDVVEETAAMMDDEPHIQGQVPVYSYAPEQVTQLIDSSGSDNEREIHILEPKVKERNISEEKVALIEHNINLLKELEMKEAVFRELESGLGIIKNQISESESSPTSPKNLLNEGEHLKHSFLQHSEQQQEIAHDLVDNLRLLQVTHKENSDVSQVIDLSTQLLSLAQKLESALNERNADVKKLNRDEHGVAKINRLGSYKAWYSTDEEMCSTPIQVDPRAGTSVDVGDLSSLVTKKVLELKNGLSRLKETTVPKQPEEQCDSESLTTYTIQISRKTDCLCEGQNNQERNNDTQTNMEILTNTEALGEDDLSPITVTVSPAFFKTKKSCDDPCDSGIAKSKTQVICSDDAEQVFKKHLKLEDRRQEQRSPELLKKRIKEKIMEMQRMTQEVRPRIPVLPKNILEEQAIRREEASIQNDGNFNDSKVVIVTKNENGAWTKKNVKARRITDTTIAYKALVPSIEPSADKDRPACSDLSDISVDTPTFVFVPTTRKIISPVRRDTSSSVISYVIDDIEPQSEGTTLSDIQCTQKSGPPDETKVDDSKQKNYDSNQINLKESSKSLHFKLENEGNLGMPPLPNSPIASRKVIQKETAPSIRMMIAKYNQKITEQDSSETASGKTSPVAWRSPVLDRRIKEQTEKFQNEGATSLKHGGKFGRGEMQKSASSSHIKTSLSNEKTSASNSDLVSKEGRSKEAGVLKSSSTGTVKPLNGLEPALEEVKKKFTPRPPIFLPSYSEAEKPQEQVPLALRALRIRQAKAEFLSKGLAGQSWSSEISPTPSSMSSGFIWQGAVDRQDSASEEMRLRNRLSHVSIGSESSFDEISVVDDLPNLIKSASAGMINIERCPSSRRRSDGSVEQPCIQVSVSSSAVPTTPSSTKLNTRFGMSNIKSRFRKVKMRKSKEKESAVSRLCRQSLVVDISHTVADRRAALQASCSKSCPASPVLERSSIRFDENKSWVPNPAKFFKKRENKNPTSEPSSNQKR